KQIADVRRGIDVFEQAPRALDGVLQQHVSGIVSLYFAAKAHARTTDRWETIADALADLVYVLAKVRGYKSVANALPSDVYLLPRLVEMVEDPGTAGRPGECYFLLLWLSRLVLVPFPLASVQTGLEAHLFQLASAFLALHRTALKTQLAALVLLALLVTRPDCGLLLDEYTATVVVDWPVLLENAKLGHLMTLNQMLKRAASGPVAGLARAVHRDVVMHEVSLAKHGQRAAQINTMNALYVLKVATKCARVFVARAEYDAVAALVNGATDLMQLMGELFDAALRECMAKNLAKTTAHLAKRATNYAAQVVSHMLGQLRLAPLAAGGYDADMRIEPAGLSVPRFHAVLLYTGFLALTKALPAQFVPAVFSLAHQTCFVSRRHYAFVQSAQLRDASCFCLWAVLRLLSEERFQALQAQCAGLVPTVFCDLIRVSLFDEDFTMRRCGIAVLQELVGRFGGVFLGPMLGTGDAHRLGEFTVLFIEQFGAATVGSMADSHGVMALLRHLGFLREWFVAPLVDEILAELSPYELQKLGLVHLAQTLAENYSTPIQLEGCRRVDEAHVVNCLVGALQRGSHSALYALAELETCGLLAPDTAESVALHVENMTLARHGPVACVGESIMHWLNCCKQERRGRLTARLGPVLAAIHRLDASAGLVLELEAFYTLSPVLSADQFDHLCHQIRSGNQLVAASVMRARLDHQQLHRVGACLADRAVDAGVRATLVRTLQPDHIGAAAFALLRPTVVLLLDDYTISEQGDIGLKPRLASVLFVEAHWRLFEADTPVLQAKLLRLAGETMDRLRIAAFRVLVRIHGGTSPAAHMAPDGGGYDAYFAALFAFFQAQCAALDDLANAFWSGIVHSAAAATGANTMINLAFRHVLLHLRDRAQRERAFSVLVALMKVAPGTKVLALDRRAQKTLQAVMGLVAKLLDAALEIPDLVAEALFVRAYNLHINTTATARIALAIRIFQYFGSAPAAAALRARSRKRLCWLCSSHANGQVRALAADALFEIANDVGANSPAVAFLDSVPW
ncbi:hypothetical protein METBIDRAFT_21748, partial [Metschnikowia bicuspidata var. bicuspidata NRRL YB-4993]